ncbi:MAG: alpha/beta fold hydrolase, partial [Acidimicrobiales bacterium]
MRSETIEVDGVDLFVRRWGEPGQPAVLLLHSMGENSETWTEVAKALAPDHAVYALDLRGHGGSDRPNQYSFELLRHDVAGVIDRLALRRVSLVGHSLGGMVAYQLAGQNPDFLERLVLEDAPPPLPTQPAPPVPDRPGGDLPFDWRVLTSLWPERNTPDPTWWSQLASVVAPTLVIGGGPDSHVDQEQMAAMADRFP